MDTATLNKRLAAVESRRDEILAGGDEAQKIRRLPDDLVDKLVDDGFFRFALPEALGGEDASACQTIEILEAIAAIDASTAWNVMLGSEINAMAAGGMEPELAKKIYLDDPKVVMCGGGGPGSTPPRAERTEDGGVRVYGQSTFISGCHNATWCFMMAPLMKGDEMEVDASGQPIAKMWFMHKDQWEIIDTWDVAGLRGSGSNDVKADGAYVPPEHFDVDLVSLPAQHENPVFRIPVPLRLSYNKVAIALGVAKGALETFADLAQNKIPMMSTSSLANRPIAQFRMGEAMANYRAVRSFVMESMKAVEDELWAGAPHPSPEATQAARLACTHGANVCMSVVDSLHNTAGTSGMRMHSPLERKLRDAHGCATHRWVSHALYQDLGGIMLGGEPTPEFIGASMR
ncbi:MAG: acyl-CoA dehydrogenase family protein [Pseudomonadaceae bacterium]|nr:acyl-CoA dehydrogenase family protein [Pseudomonadaceae bacterium]